MLGLMGRIVPGMIVGAILGALVGEIVGYRFAEGSGQDYGLAIITAWVVMGAWLGAGIGFLVVVFRSIDRRPNASEKSVRDQVDKSSR
jgi:uncharacterized protein YcfJ